MIQHHTECFPSHYFVPTAETEIIEAIIRVTWDRGMVIGGLGQKPDWKKWPGLSDNDMVTGGLSNRFEWTHLISWLVNIRYEGTVHCLWFKVKMALFVIPGLRPTNCCAYVICQMLLLQSGNCFLVFSIPFSTRINHNLDFDKLNPNLCLFQAHFCVFQL